MVAGSRGTAPGGGLGASPKLLFSSPPQAACQKTYLCKGRRPLPPLPTRYSAKALGGFVATLPVFLAELSYQFLRTGIAHSPWIFGFRLTQVFAKLTDTDQLLLGSRSIGVILSWSRSCAITIPIGIAISASSSGTHRHDRFP